MNRYAAGFISAGALLAATSAFAQIVSVENISPVTTPFTRSTSGAGASGGRATDITVAPSNGNILFAATEFGGIHKSTDRGRSWVKLHDHRPNVTWAVAVHPADANRVIATSFYDGRVANGAGISISTDGGTSWMRPASVTPPPGFCADADAQTETRGYGLAIDPAASANVYAGTSCGLAISRDSGATWTYLNPSPSSPGARAVYDVIVGGGAIDICGDGGHQRSTDGGASWTWPSYPYSVGRYCSIVRSPKNRDVLFTSGISGHPVKESRDGGLTWPITYTPAEFIYRPGHIAANNRAGAAYDLWFSGIFLRQAQCLDLPALASPLDPSCAPVSSWIERRDGAHADPSTIVFDPAVRVDACPLAHASDGGLYYEANIGAPACHTPVWREADRAARALHMYDLTGRSLDDPNAELISVSLQDNGMIIASDSTAPVPAWDHIGVGDSFESEFGENYVLKAIGPPVRLVRSPLGAPLTGLLLPGPPGVFRAFSERDLLVTVSPGIVAASTDAGVFLSSDLRDFSAPTVWTRIPGGGAPANLCALTLSRGTGSGWTLFALSPDVSARYCAAHIAAPLYRYDSIAPAAGWRRINRGGVSQFGAFGVDPNNPQRIIAADLSDGTVEMVATTDGGGMWTRLPALDAAMTGGGVFATWNATGHVVPQANDGYPQPSLIRISPFDSGMIVAGANDAGVHLSVDGGASWTEISNTVSPSAAAPAIPRPRDVYFDGLRPGLETDLYVASIGSGVWRVKVDTDDLCAGGSTCVDLAVKEFHIDGPARVVTSEGVEFIYIPAIAKIVNRGTAPASGPFKAAATFTGLAFAPTREFVLSFLSPDTSDSFYPRRGAALLPGETWTVNGELVVLRRGLLGSISVRVETDSCSGDEFMPPECRVLEADEANNFSLWIEVSLLSPGT